MLQNQMFIIIYYEPEEKTGGFLFREFTMPAWSTGRRFGRDGVRRRQPRDDVRRRQRGVFTTPV